MAAHTNCLLGVQPISLTVLHDAGYADLPKLLLVAVELPLHSGDRVPDIGDAATLEALAHLSLIIISRCSDRL